METNSTVKIATMLAKAGRAKKSVVPDNATYVEQAKPQLTPSAEMEQILANILGPSAAKKLSPLEK